jgi:hypothetical protein
LVVKAKLCEILQKIGKNRTPLDCNNSHKHHLLVASRLSGDYLQRDLDDTEKIHWHHETRDGGKESAAADLIAKGYFDADESVKSDDR